MRVVDLVASDRPWFDLLSLVAADLPRILRDADETVDDEEASCAAVVLAQ